MERAEEGITFVGQELNRTTGMSCYIQMSMIGASGAVIIGDTLRKPYSGSTLMIPSADNIWRTPMYFSRVWHGRRMAHLMDDALRRVRK